jgi:hypothetical protein
MAVVVSGGPVSTPGVVVGEFFMVCVSVWIEGFGVGIDTGAVVKSPCWYEDSCVSINIPSYISSAAFVSFSLLITGIKVAYLLGLGAAKPLQL